MEIEVSQLFLYPVKSLRGIAINSSTLHQTGFLHDRYWMIVKPDGGFITQRQFPQMILIHTHLTDSSLILSKEGMKDLEIPLEYNQNNSEAFSARVWKDTCEVIDEGKESSIWLTEAIGTPKTVRLVRMKGNFQRPQDKPDLLGEKTHTFFADAAPYLVTNEASLEKINTSMRDHHFESVTIEHFRPNIVIKGPDAFQEHNINRLIHEKYAFEHCYPCQRCIIPTIDIETGIRHSQQQPFSLISELNAMPDNPKAPAFGENAILISGEGQAISVGDKLTVS
jgi:uncharacterized protein YcbX